MKYSYRLDAEERLRLAKGAQVRLRREYGPHWLAKLHWYFVLPGMVAGVALLSGQPWLAAIFFAAVYLIIYGYSWLYGKFALRAQARGEDVPHFQDWTVEFRDDSIAFTTTHINSDYRWTAFSGWEEGINYLFLKCTPGTVLYIPKRAIQNPAELAQVKLFLNDRIRRTA